MYTDNMLSSPTPELEFKRSNTKQERKVMQRDSKNSTHDLSVASGRSANKSNTRRGRNMAKNGSRIRVNNNMPMHRNLRAK